MEELSFSEILASGHNRIEKAKLVAEKIRSSGRYTWVGLYDVNEKEIKIITCEGRSEPVFTSFPKDKGLNGKAVMKRQTILVNDTDKDEDYLLTFSNTKSEIIVPVFDPVRQEIVGTIDVEGETKNTFSKKDIEFLEECAKNIQSLWTGN
jgi:L-methionine (R)-S-oxide reductase